MPSPSEADQQAILALARRAVTEAVCHTGRLEHIPNTGIFAEKRGVFVTLHVAKRLHGCIGVIEAKEPLGEAVAHCAQSAALEDPRFNRMQPADLPTLEIEVSLLSPLEPIQPDEVEIGKHGLLIEQGFHRGLLLPQVAVEQTVKIQSLCASVQIWHNQCGRPPECQIGYTLFDLRHRPTKPRFSLGLKGLLAGRLYLTRERSGSRGDPKRTPTPVGGSIATHGPNRPKTRSL